MQQNIQSINQLVRDLLIPIIGSASVHIIIFVILSSLIHYWSAASLSNKTRPTSLIVKLAADSSEQSLNIIPLKDLSGKSKDSKYTGGFPLPKIDTNHSLFKILPSRYYTIKEVDRPPTLLIEVDSTSLESLRFAKGGELALRFWIDEEGNVINTEIAQSNLPDEFNQKAMALFSDVKFSPGVRNDQPVKTILKIVIRYAAEEK